jgi:glycosyltransferase involved in cell wall biosynthesis
MVPRRDGDAARMTRRRVALLTEIPAPYRIPLFNALAARVDLRVLFLAESNPDRPYRLHEEEHRFSSEVLPGFDVAIGRRWLVVNRGVARLLGGMDAVVVGGWNQPAFWAAVGVARLRRVPAVAWVESTERDARPGSTAGTKRAFARACSSLVVPGRAAEAYVRSVAPLARVVVAPNAVDGPLFASRLPDREALRAQHGLDRFCVLYVGRLAPEKGVDVLLRAAAGLDATVVLAGAGPEEGRLRDLAPPGTRFLGHVDRDELPAWYAAADVLVLPSLSEPWGMPLNEGAAAGLPLVATDAVGAAWDLVDDGVNGFRVPAGDVAALHDALARLVADRELRRAAGARSRELAASFTPDAWADAVAGEVTR